MQVAEQKYYFSLQKIILILCLLSVLLMPWQKTFADAPFITDDPDVMDPGGWDAILYATLDKYKSYTSLQAPALEFDIALFRNTEFDIYLPYQNNINVKPDYRSLISNNSGIGDTDVEFKYRFMKETTYLPTISFVPNFYFPTGNSSKGLGNGRTWYTLPITMQKTFDKWTTYVELGYGLNSASFAVNYLFGGWVVTKNITDKLILGAEIFSQGKSSDLVSSFTLLNFGVTYQLSKHGSLLFSLGHGIVGQEQWTSYLGIEYA
jgi:hypothetical protein